ncbi:MAG: hypothetical protein IJK33_04335 [Clostridia bacterium]|nr:hypothetical protein [Clostridia bacterium]MBQ7500907.1 hypothetical protein [Clostridia bacterium]
MDGYRIANFVMQAVCVSLHLLFILGFLRRRQSTPIWRWFVVVTVGLWMLISGRFFESVAYLFLPNNAFYTFAVYWQFVGTTFATYAYLFWNLHLAGLERAAESKALRFGLFSVSAALCLVICTNHHFGLFYKKLVMGEPVVHGPVHTPWIVWVYGMLFVGYVISVVNIIRKGKEKIKRIAVFSMFPLFPAIAALIRSVTGVDELDYTPLVVAISVFCMYLIVFRRNYVNLIPQSMESALKQTESALVVYDPASGAITYKNRAAEVYAEYLPQILQCAGEPGDVREEKFGPATLRIRVSGYGDGASRLITVTDVTSLTEQHSRLEEEIVQRDEAVHELEDTRRNIDAYLEALYQIPDLKEKQALFDGTKDEAVQAFAAMQSNMDHAADDIADCEPLLNETIERSEKTLASVRKAVAKMKEGSV